MYALLFRTLGSTNQLFNTYLKIKALQNNTIQHPTNLTFSKPLLNRFVNSKIYFQTPRFLRSNQAKFSNPNTFSFYNLFLIYIQYTTLNSQQFFVPHTNFKYMFLFAQNKTNSYLNLTKVYVKWVNTSNFIINLFLIQSHILVFTVKTLKNEALSFNWSSNVLNYNLFKYASPIFFNKDASFGTTSTLIFKKFNQNNLHTVFLTDVKYHEKNLHYFKKFHITTIGLISYNLNPWLVTYAIPTSNNSLFIQYFFLKLLIYFRQCSLQTKYNSYKTLWI